MALAQRRGDSEKKWRAGRGGTFSAMNQGTCSVTGRGRLAPVAGAHCAAPPPSPGCPVSVGGVSAEEGSVSR